MATGEALPAPVATELRRVAERWQQLPLDHALSRMPLMRDIIDHFAGGPVPDLGPAVVIDQLTVVVFDAVVGPSTEAESEAAPQVDVVARLVALRRALAF